MIGHFYFSRRDNYVLMSNDTGAICFLSPQEFDQLCRNKRLPESEKWLELVDKHFCYETSEETFLRNSEDAIRDGNTYLFEPTSLFIFAVTNECNNRCVYCQANGCKNPEMMNERVAVAALSKIAESPSQRVTIEFQGGEPLMNYHIIKYIVLQAHSILRNKNVGFTVVSNLSLLTEEMAAFFKKYHVSVSTSLDGPAALHDKNRPAANGGSSFLATLRGKELLKKTGIIPGAIETTTAYSLGFAEKIVDAYVQNGFTQLFIRPLTRLGAAKRAWKEIGYTSGEFISFYKRALERIIWYNQNGIRIKEYQAALFSNKALLNKSVNYMERRSPCGAGLGQMAITANGNVYTCDEGRMAAEMGDEAFCIGNVLDNGYNDWIESSACRAVCSTSLLETLPGCCDCVYKPYCGVCPVINYMINGNLSSVSRDRCEINKGIMDILVEYIKDGDPEIMNIFTEWGCEA